MKKTLLSILFLLSSFTAEAATLSWGWLPKDARNSSGEFVEYRIVQIADGDWYAFWDVNNKFVYAKSTDKGRTWSQFVTINDAQTIIKIAVWYDRWTPGDSGDYIHIVYMEQSTHDVNYRNLNTSTDTVSAETVIFNGASFAISADTALSLTKTKAANLYVVFDGDAGTEVGHYQAASPYTTWNSKTDANEGGSDWYFALPGNYADTDDYDLYFVDRSADGWSRKTYDASGNSWSESALIADGSMIDVSTMFPQTGGCISTTDSMQYAFAWNDHDTATADLVGWKWDGTTSTALTNVVTNSDDAGSVSCMFDEATSTIYVYYLGKSDGSQTSTATVGIYYKSSTDDGTTWSAEQTFFSAILDDYRQQNTPPNIATASAGMPMIWFNDDTTELPASAENPSGSSSDLLGVIS